MNDEEISSLIALTQIPGLGVVGIRSLLNALGDASQVFARQKDLKELVPGCTDRLVKAIADGHQAAFVRARQELEFIRKNQIECFSINDDRYPQRLRECDDAPVLLFYRGNAELNTLRVINMIGTRNATDYGRRLCYRFLQELKELLPDVLVVSGLAYGIDIHAHRAALEAGMNTVGVLAHGLDRIYPAAHRKTAVDMLRQGGLLTEYMSGTTPDRQNFVRRNRIVAGMSDATIVVESASKGGALITAGIAESYHRDCFAFPGRVDDEFSQGCNKLIKDNKAVLIQNAEDFVKAMCWDTGGAVIKNIPIQRQMFLDLTGEEERVVSFLKQEGEQQINSIVVNTDISINKLNAILFELEMKGVVRVLAGGVYKLL